MKNPGRKLPGFFVEMKVEEASSFEKTTQKTFAHLGPSVGAQ
jgi:hypothetical protein